MAKKKTAKPPKTARGKIRKARSKADEEFAVLGRFIQDFERLVANLRDDCRDAVIGEQRGIIVDKEVHFAEQAHHNICSLIFHHDVMTARAIVELWQALAFEQTRTDVRLTGKTKEIISGVSRTLAADLTKLIETRNRLLHATWNIGTWYDPEDFKFQFSVTKFRVGNQGFERRADLPKTIDDLRDYSRQITEIKSRIHNFNAHRKYRPDRFETGYVKIKQRWEEKKP